MELLLAIGLITVSVLVDAKWDAHGSIARIILFVPLTWALIHFAIKFW